MSEVNGSRHQAPPSTPHRRHLMSGNQASRWPKSPLVICLGLVPALDGCKIIALTAESVLLETPDGVRQSYCRKPDRVGRGAGRAIGS